MSDISLEELLEALRRYPGLTRKAHIGPWAGPFTRAAAKREGVYGPGDDAGAVEMGSGYLLLAGEGLWDPLLEDPEFAGFCAVSVNVNDIYAMGGRPLGILCVVFEGGMSARSRGRFLSGLQRGIDHYDVPLLGGHTGPGGDSTCVAVCIAGRADRLLRGDGAAPGDAIVAALDLEGVPHDPFHAWDTVGLADPERTRTRLDTLVEIAERGLATACRDVSNPGILGTLAMMLEASGTGAEVEIDAIPTPPGVELGWWLAAYPSFGFLLAVRPSNLDAVMTLLRSRGVDCAAIGRVVDGSRLEVTRHGERELFVDWRERPVTGIFPGTSGD